MRNRGNAHRFLQHAGRDIGGAGRRVLTES